MKPFAHLHTHSHYSLLSALPKIDDLVDAAVNDKMTALALTDNGNLYGAIEFYKACKAKNIQPIIGVDFYVAARSRKDMQAGIDNRRTRLILLATNNKGYHNLIELVTKSHLEGFYYKPRIDRELLEKYNEGLIAISPSFSGEIALALKGRNQDKAKEIASYYKKVFASAVTPAKAGAQRRQRHWIPAFAGMSGRVGAVLQPLASATESARRGENPSRADMNRRH